MRSSPRIVLCGLRTCSHCCCQSRSRTLSAEGDSIAALNAQDPPPTLRRADISRLLNVSGERTRQIANGADFPPPVITNPHRASSREEVLWWMDDVKWWGRYRWRRPAPDET